MIINRLFVFLLRHLWRLVRWAALSVYHGIAVLYRRRQARLQASDWRPRTVYTGRWQLADDGQCCGRAVVLRLSDALKPGVELLYFGEESAEPRGADGGRRRNVPAGDRPAGFTCTPAHSAGDVQQNGTLLAPV